MVKIIIETLTDKGYTAVQQHIKEFENLPLEARQKWRSMCSEEWLNNYYILNIKNRIKYNDSYFTVQPEAILNKIRRTMKKNKAKELKDYEIRLSSDDEEGF